MALQTPIQITLYDPETDEVIKTYSRAFVPWKLLSYAVAIMKDIDTENMTEETVDQITGLVVEAFGNKFSIEELKNGSDMGEMMTVLNTIISKATNNIANPTPPGK